MSLRQPGNRKTQWTVPAAQYPDGGGKTEELDISFFKPVTELMVDMAMLEVGIMQGHCTNHPSARGVAHHVRCVRCSV